MQPTVGSDFTLPGTADILLNTYSKAEGKAPTVLHLAEIQGNFTPASTLMGSRANWLGFQELLSQKESVLDKAASLLHHRVLGFRLSMNFNLVLI